MRSKKLLTLIGSVCLILVLAAMSFMTACPAPPEEEKPTPSKWPEVISFGTASPTGGWHAMGVAMSELITKHVPGVTCTAEATGGGGKNIMLLHEEELELAFLVPGQVWKGLRGVEEYSEVGPTPMRILWGHYPLYNLAVCRAGIGLKNPANWRGKVIYGDEPHSPSVKMALLSFLKAYNIKEEEVSIRSFTKTAEAIIAIKEGTADVMWTPCGLAYPPYVELFQTTDCEICEFSEEAVRFVIKDLAAEFYSLGYYPVCLKGQEKPQVTIQKLVAIVCREDLPDDLAYAITKAVWDHRDILYVSRPEFDEFFRNYDLAVSKDNVGPFHDGAIKYWKEVGAWTSEMDKWQKEKLAELKASK